MEKEFRKNIKGRGSSGNTENRFASSRYVAEEQEWENFQAKEEVAPLLKTEFLTDSSRSIITENNSPDVPFTFSVNPYRGCEHGCAYCYARPTHEYLGFSAGLDFESRILVKKKAPELLRKELMAKKWKPQVISFSGITDCYQPVERQLQLTRSCLEVLLEFKNPVSLITKNRLITRDIDLLKGFAEFNAVIVFISVTTLDNDLCSHLEPRTSRPSARLAAINELSENGIPVGVNVAPVIPGLTDHEMPNILKCAARAGAKWAGYIPIRLPLAVLPIFSQWLEVHHPQRKQRVLNQIRSLRGGRLNDANFGSRMTGEGAIGKYLEQMFRLACRKEGLNNKKISLSVDHFTRPGDQLSWF